MTELWKDKKDIPMFDENSEDKTVPSVDEYIIPDSRSCVVICPGGGYAIKSFDHEGIQIAKWFNSIGTSAMVLDYRLNPYKHPVPLYDVKRAIRYARSKAKEYGYDGDKIGVMGFSAGGHLAASAITAMRILTKRTSSAQDRILWFYATLLFLLLNTRITAALSISRQSRASKRLWSSRLTKTLTQTLLRHFCGTQAEMTAYRLKIL